MIPRNWFQSYKASQTITRSRRHAPKSRPRCRLAVEALEERTVPSASISFAGATINEIGDVSAFVPPGSGGLSSPRDLVLGSDGNVYVASSGTNSVLRYNGATGQLVGTFVAANSGGLNTPFGLAFGPDGNLYVDSEGTSAIYCYNGSTGAFLSTFVSAGSGGLNDPKGILFGQDGNLYVSSHVSNSILRYEGPTGPAPGSPLPAAGQSGATFVAAGSGGLAGPKELVFGPGGSLYVASGVSNFSVLRFDETSGNFISTYVAPGAGGLSNPTGLAFDQDGRLYIADVATNAIHRYDGQGQYLDDPVASTASSLRAPVGMIFDAQGSLLISSRDANSVGRYARGVVVTLSSASPTPVTVDYTTADGTATANKDYTAQAGTVAFAPGQTSREILLVTREDLAVDGNETFNIQLANATGGATIATGNAVVTIVEPSWPQLTITDASAIEGNNTPHYRGAFVNGYPGAQFNPVTFGPDGNLYTAVGTGPGYNTIQRYNGTTGAFMGTFASGPINGVREIAFRAGSMYVASEYTNEVFRYDASTGAFVGAFVTAGSGGINGPYAVSFGPDANGDGIPDLYVSGRNSNSVVRYDGATGAPLGTYVTSGSHGLNLPEGMTFDPTQTYLYVASSGSTQILKYNAVSGAYIGVAANAGLNSPHDVKFGPDGLMYVTSGGNNRILRYTASGAYLDDFVPAGSGGMVNPHLMTFGPNGDLYLATTANTQLLRFGTESEAVFTVSTSTSSPLPASVNYATTDGTAIAGTNYTATSGTLAFAPGITTATIDVPILNDGVADPSLTFTVTLSNALGATLARSQAVGTISDSNTAAKFYVVNDATSSIGGTNTTYKYQASGTAEAPYGLSVNDLDPRGVASTAAGTTNWVVDANKNVYVYSTGGTLLGSWFPGGLSSSAQLTGIATNGTDIWLVESYSAKVYKYTGAASRLSGSQNAASSFSLAGGRNGNTNPQDIVTDGTSFWVVDGSKLKVFKSTLSGSSLGSWTIDRANAHPTGITINPTNVSDIWIVDNGTDKVYQYIGAASRTSGSQNAGATFALAPGNTNPQGIADPPPVGMMLSQTTVTASTPVRPEAGSLRYVTRPIDNVLWGPVMSAMPTSGSLLPLTQGEWNLALQLDPVHAGSSDQADSAVQAPRPAGREHRAPSSSCDLVDTAILDQVFADMV